MDYMKKNNDINFTSVDYIEKGLMKKPGYKAAREKSRLKYLLIKAIIEARGKQGLTQRELAKQLNITQSALARFESGNANPTLEFVGKIVSGLNLKLSIS